MRDDAGYLRDILEAIELVERYALRGRGTFESDELVQVWIVHHIQIIGEAVRRLSQDLRTRHPEVPWVQVAAMRNVLVHDYFRIDLDEVWQTVERDVPALKNHVQAILNQLGQLPDRDC